MIRICLVVFRFEPYDAFRFPGSHSFEICDIVCASMAGQNVKLEAFCGMGDDGIEFFLCLVIQNDNGTSETASFLTNLRDLSSKICIRTDSTSEGR